MKQLQYISKKEWTTLAAYMLMISDLVSAFVSSYLFILQLARHSLIHLFIKYASSC
jgi:hypothetical protein